MDGCLRGCRFHLLDAVPLTFLILPHTSGQPIFLNSIDPGNATLFLFLQADNLLTNFTQHPPPPSPIGILAGKWNLHTSPSREERKAKPDSAVCLPKHPESGYTADECDGQRTFPGNSLGLHH